MIAWQLAKHWWDNNVATKTFEETLGWHLTNGLIYSTPQCFLLAHECHWNGEKCDDAGKANAWFIELASSSAGPSVFRQFMRVASRPHEWVLWHRHGSFERVRAYRWEKLSKKIGGK